MRLTRIMGIEIRLDASWFVIAALLTWSLSQGYVPALLPATDALQRVAAALVSMLALFGSLILHELAHATVARAHGMGVNSITLFLFGGVAELRDEPPDARTEFRVAIAGPVASLAISAVFALGWWAAPALGLSDLVVVVLGYVALANLVLAVFNMVPAFPLDGGRVLRAWLWRSRDLAGATRIAGGVSNVVAFAMIGLGVIQVLSGSGVVGIWPVLLALFILTASSAARSRVDLAEALAGRTVRQVMKHDPVSVDPSLTLADLVDGVMLRHAVSFVPVVEAGRFLGVVDLPTVRGIERENWPHTRVDDVFQAMQAADVLAPNMDAGDLLDRMVRTGKRKFAVLDRGRLVGVVTLGDLMARVRLKAELAQHAR
ncbi:site-2 protease family protein [Jannaschia pohangensis]|nr:site-2 protease family protein [Jannaschia pohangensis]